ncbi:DUF805 domain-containing protein [Pseudaminobacter sp. 19-2017]|uniref:DUF805 domain-containing protein n=1 Tax=Pseudaminobacter soli (ex Zhang et al. 2022) TaxID=2831468 RepID=A0A942IBS7_9HYPH|nr:DUF805 domain-containing protein [Pseudaminobacter soli]MBS3652595.1 DUF805 domain-containing protein [Pseudaminobacter soli]
MVKLHPFSVTPEGGFVTGTQILFSFNGRIARLRYLWWSIFAVLMVFVIDAIGFWIHLSDEDGTGWVGLLIIGVMSVIGFWMGLALTMKRLHDMGLAGVHAIWINGLGLGANPIVASAPPEYRPILSVIVLIFGIGVVCWLLFTPGQKHQNQYGPVPGELPMPIATPRPAPRATVL